MRTGSVLWHCLMIHEVTCDLQKEGTASITLTKEGILTHIFLCAKPLRIEMTSLETRRLRNCFEYFCCQAPYKNDTISLMFYMF